MDVSIPHTSLSTDGSHTLYHVEVKVGEKTYLLKKRYTDFANLKNELQSMFSTNLPYQFPKKTFLRKTVNNSSLAENRRLELEVFLKNVAHDSDDLKWKKSLPFKEFLNLPPGIFSNVNESVRDKVDNAWSLTAKQGEPIIDLTSWLEIARETKKKLQLARNSIHKLPSEARKNLVLSRTQFEGLSKGLSLAEEQQLIGEGELKRRTELLNSLRREHSDIDQLLSSVTQFPDERTQASSLQQPFKAQLFKGRVIGKPQETERTRGLDNQELLQIQKNDFKEQDQELELLSKAIERQKQLGMAINDELALQNDLLNELDDEVDRASSKLHYAQKRVGKFT